MRMVNQILFVISVLALSWFGMMAFHEMGHVLGALVCEGNVQKVVLYPLTISRTEVSRNPHPLLVVWSGPILGCVAPAIIAGYIPKNQKMIRRLSTFFAGFCLVANGAYIGAGAF